MGPKAHLVTYPISGGRQINVVAVVPGTWNRPGWSAPGEAKEIKKAFEARWPGTARMMINAVDDWRKWALFTLPDDGEWSDGPIALLGDAIHAMLPFAAQGAGMAIEDAAVLAQCLGETGQNTAGIPAALKRYARLRRTRVRRVQRAARRNGRIYHLTGAMAFARDLAIKAIGARHMLARQDWLYDWRA
jgi:salicylate hydroxylase